MLRNRYILFLLGGMVTGLSVRSLLAWLGLGFESGIALVTAIELLLIIGFCLGLYHYQNRGENECE